MNVVKGISDKKNILPIINYTGGMIDQLYVNEERDIKNTLILNALEIIFQEAERQVRNRI